MNTLNSNKQKQKSHRVMCLGQFCTSCLRITQILNAKMTTFADDTAILSMDADVNKLQEATDIWIKK